MEQSTDQRELLPDPPSGVSHAEEVTLRDEPAPPNRGHELVRIYADPVRMAQALAAMQHSESLLSEMQKIKSRMTWMTMVATLNALIIAALCVGLAMAGMG